MSPGMVDESGDGERVYNLGLTVRGKAIRFQARVPQQPARVTELLPIIHGLEQISVDAATARAEESGKPISCRAGCGACCRQLVPVARSEALHLAELVESMPAERREKYRARFREALEGFERGGLGERLREIHQSEDAEETRTFGHAYFDQRIACPFLEDESCSIHPDRPLSCREYLVTSPAENCSAPSAETVDRVPFATHLSHILFRFEDGKGETEPRWLPLVRSLEWASENGASAAAFPGAQLFENFVKRFVGSIGGADPEEEVP